MIDNEVYPIHEWRKFDSLSFALNYYEGDGFSSPSTQFINEEGNTKAASEFPIIYYLFGVIWSVVGVSVLSTKILGLLFSIFSVFLTSSIIFEVTKSFKKQVAYVVFFFLCPVYTYYFHSLIPNIYSFNFLLLSVYFLYKYTKSLKTFDYLLFSLFISLSILIKLTSLIAILSLLGAGVFYFLFVKKCLFSRYRKLLFHVSATLLFALTCTFLWYYHAIEYNAFHGSNLFSTTIRPVWEVAPEKVSELWKNIFLYQINGLYHPIILFSLISIVTIISILKKLYYPLIFIGVSAIGITSYLMLWFWAIQNHDYYLIELIYFPICLFVFLLILVKDLNKRAQVVSWCLGLLTMLSSVAISQKSYGMNNLYTKYSPFLTQIEKGNKWWFHSNHKTHLGALQKVDNELQSLIPSHARVFSISDSSPNAHLFLLQRKGYSGFVINKLDVDLNEKLESLGIQSMDVVLNYSDDSNIESLDKNLYSLIYSDDYIQAWSKN